MTLGQYWLQILALFPPVLARLIPAWLLTFFLLCYGFRWIKVHIRPAVLRLDNHVRHLATGCRYKERGNLESERHALTWFFRFWTNFSSSPALCLFSLLVPTVVYYALPKSGTIPTDSPTPLSHLALAYTLPSFSFASGMLLSFVSKKVFKRLRPERPHGSFGHKLKDGSFPSGHSLTSLCFWSMLVVATSLAGQPSNVIVGMAAVALGVVSFTGLSRIYLGVHFPSDVLGGYTIGAIWTLVCYFTLVGLL